MGGPAHVGIETDVLSQLKAALLQSTNRVVDVFRLWDEDRSGTVDYDEVPTRTIRLDTLSTLIILLTTMSVLDPSLRRWSELA